jgi:hypothetical protein
MSFIHQLILCHATAYQVVVIVTWHDNPETLHASDVLNPAAR